MKVLMICTVPLYGNGIAACVVNYASHLVQQKCKVHILAPEGVPQAECEALSQRNIILHQLPNRKSGVAGYLLRLYKILRAEKYDVVHVHGNSCTMAIELLAAALSGCPGRVAHSHNTSCDHKRAHKILRPLFELCVNGRLACGEEAGRWLFRNKPFQAVRNGIDLNKYAFDPMRRELFRKEMGLDDDTLVLGHVGAFVPAKNHEFLIELANRLKADGQKNCKLLLVGAGPLFQQIRSLAGENVIFTGGVADASGYLQAMDVFLLPSFHEGLPFVLVEAQAAGLPSLVSDRVSPEADMTGSLCFLPIDAVSGWVNALETLTGNDRKRQSTDGCIALKNAGYAMEDNGQVLADYYSDLLK